MAKILYVAPYLGYPPIGGPELRTFAVVQVLSRAADLQVFSLESQAEFGGEAAIERFSQFCRRLYFSSYAWSGHPGTWAQKLRRFPLRAVHFWRTFRDVKAVIRLERPDVIWLGYGAVTYPYTLLKLGTGCRLVLDTDSVYSRFILRELVFARGLGRMVRVVISGVLKAMEELIGSQLADVITAVSDVDRRYYRILALRGQPVEILTNAIDSALYTKIERAPAEANVSWLCFSGSMNSPSNIDAAFWLIEKVMPQVWKCHPDLWLYIVGYGPPEGLQRHGRDKVKVTGYVPSVLPYLQGAELVVVPSRFESGTRFKILEAFASGKAVVSTKLGAEGLAVEHGRNILIADTADEFAAAVLSLLNDPGRCLQLGHEGRRLVRQEYDLDAAERQIRVVLQHCLAGEV